MFRIQQSAATELPHIPPDTEKLAIEHNTSLVRIAFPALPHLVELDIVRSAREIAAFSPLPNLRALKILNNPITKLPDSIGDLRHLTHLTISANLMLTRLPAQLGNLARLSHLEISDNAVAEFPDSLSRLSALSHLRLSGCELGQVPAFIKHLALLAHLNLAENNIRSVPDFVAALPLLQSLNLEDNPRLEHIPTSLKKITAFDRDAYASNLHRAKRQTQRAVHAKQRTMNAIRPRNPQPADLPGLATDPIMLRSVVPDAWIRDNPSDHFMISFDSKLFAMKRSYFQPVVPYFILETCDDSDSGANEYVALEKYGIPIPAVVPLRTIARIVASTASHFRAKITDHSVRTRPQLLIRNTVIRDTAHIHHEHTSVLPVRLQPYIKSYSNKWDSYINHYLRSAMAPAEYSRAFPRFHDDFAASAKEGVRQIVEFIAAIDDAFENHAETAAEPLTVYRGTKDPPHLRPYSGIMAGFTSTSTNPIIAENFADPECCIYRCVIDSGVPFLSIQKYSIQSFEDEILLPRGIVFDLVDTVEPADRFSTKEYVFRVRLASESQFAQHRYTCKSFPVVAISAIRSAT